MWLQGKGRVLFGSVGKGPGVGSGHRSLGPHDRKRLYKRQNFGDLDLFVILATTLKPARSQEAVSLDRTMVTIGVRPGLAKSGTQDGRSRTFVVGDAGGERYETNVVAV